MKYNTEKLIEELQIEGIEAGGCNEFGIVWDKDNNEIQDREDVRAVIKAHDPTPILEETLEAKINRIVDEKLASK